MAAQVTIRCTNGEYKFVVLENEKGEMVVFADEHLVLNYHSVLLVQYIKESGLHAWCVGGGRIDFDGEAKKIAIYGSSEDYGVEPSRVETVNAIKAAYPDFYVTGD